MGLWLDDDAVGEHVGAMEVLFACSQTLHRWCCSCTELQRNLVCNMLKKNSYPAKSNPDADSSECGHGVMIIFTDCSIQQMCV